MIAQRGNEELRSGSPLAQPKRRPHIERKRGPERSDGMTGETLTVVDGSAVVEEPGTSGGDPGSSRLNPSGELYSGCWRLGGGKFINGYFGSRRKMSSQWFPRHKDLPESSSRGVERYACGRIKVPAFVETPGFF